MIRLAGLSPQALGFGFKDWRPDQLPAAERILNSDKKIIILSAPTGSGKSAIVQIPARISQSNQVILTRTKALQKQYELDNVLALYGRSNYICNTMPIQTADYGKCRSGHECHLMYGGCDYFDAKRAAVKCQQKVLNYRYFFLEANGPGEFSGLDYLVCDEGHSVPNEISESFSIRFGNWEFKRFRLKKPEGLDSVKSWMMWARDLFTRFLLQSQRYIKQDLIISARNFLGKLSQLDAIIDPDNYIVSNDKAGSSIRPIWPNVLASRLLFSHAKKFIFSSATLNPWHLSQELGFSIGDIEYIQIPSRFPKENRPIYLRTNHNPKYGSTQLELLALVRDLDKIIDEYPDRKGIIHSASYALAETICNYSYHARRFITHKSDNRGEALEEFKASKDGILVSPSMMEGVDLPYELCEFSILAKLPFPNLGDPVWKARFSGDRARADRTYQSQTISSVIQAAGRGVRASDDYCDTWILDAAFNRLYQNHKNEFPSHFREAITNA